MMKKQETEENDSPPTEPTFTYTHQSSSQPSPSPSTSSSSNPTFHSSTNLSFTQANTLIDSDSENTLDSNKKQTSLASKGSTTSSTSFSTTSCKESSSGIATSLFKPPPPAMGIKHSKSDHSNLGRKEKPAKDKTKSGDMGKKFISKSHDNLSNGKKSRQLPPKLTSPRVESSPRSRQQVISSAPAVTATKMDPLPVSDRDKENQALKDRGKKNTGSDTEVFAKPRQPPAKSIPCKNDGLIVKSNLRKASSTQSINKSSQGSLSNASLKSNGSAKSTNNTLVAMKRAQSTQNISKDKFTKKRTSAPADVMAYNAELLANFEKEKKLLEIRISELTKLAESRKVEIEKCKYEVKRLKSQLSSSLSDQETLEELRNQNKLLNERLLELGYPAEQITDTEKILLKFSSCSSATCGEYKNPNNPNPGSSCSDICLPTSASCDSLSTDGGGSKADLYCSNSISNSEPGGLLLEEYCATPDHPSVLSLETASSHWDKQSNKSANSDGGNSEVSVACLTERILQMEETNYSTAEELQATLQELGDLQDAVNELTEDNSRLVDEKSVLLESLCTQTEKLEKTRIQLEQLKCLLISGELPDKQEMDGHLRGLLKSAAEEREELMRKQTEWSNALEGLETECKEAQEAGEALRDKYSLLEATNKSLSADKSAADLQLTETRGQLETEKIEVVRLKTLLDTERKKVLEMETARMAQDKTDVETLLDAARRGKAGVEEKLAEVNERLARSQCEVTRVKELLSSKDQELIVWRNNSYEEKGKLRYQLEEVEKERLGLMTEMEALRSHVVELEEECDRLGEEKTNMASKLQELQAELKNALQQKLVLDAEIQEMRCRHDTESEEWHQFQKDLQTAVVIANNFSQETRKSMEMLSDDKAHLEDQVSSLQAEVDRLKEELKVAVCSQSSVKESPSRKYPIMTNAELKGKVGKVMNSVDRELAALTRDVGRSSGQPTSSTLDQRSQSISVKSLIRCIEEKVKSGQSSKGQSSHSESRRSSNSSDISLKDLVISPLITPESPHSPTKDFALRAASLRVSAPPTSSCASSKPPRERSPQARLSLTPTSCASVSSGVLVTGGDSSSKSVCAGGIFSTPSRLDGASDIGGSGGKVASYHPISSILKDRGTARRSSGALEIDLTKKESPSKDPLAFLAKQMKGSKRNSLLKWCQMKTIQYSNIDITNFSSSWNDGLAFCALLHSYVPQNIPYATLNSEDKTRNFTLAFKVGESIGIKSNLNINEMVCMERPDWQAVMSYVTSIYKHFEVDRQ